MHYEQRAIHGGEDAAWSESQAEIFPVRGREPNFEKCAIISAVEPIRAAPGSTIGYAGYATEAC